ncbi:helix-turn-helix domain-containing protein [Nocardia sp. NPDC047654]|uniref:helix-turn-helix domain-containing protein n=1 Tax=Nocardia sp. NPDC047654 TaxID=3364314 RepID=UPI00371FD2F0
MLWEQRYRAVMEVRDGPPVGEVAARYGVTRQSVTAWRKRYEQDGLDGLRERSRRPHHSSARIPAESRPKCASYGARTGGQSQCA